MARSRGLRRNPRGWWGNTRTFLRRGSPTRKLFLTPLWGMWSNLASHCLTRWGQRPSCTPEAEIRLHWGRNPIRAHCWTFGDSCPENSETENKKYLQTNHRIHVSFLVGVMEMILFWEKNRISKTPLWNSSPTGTDPPPGIPHYFLVQKTAKIMKRGKLLVKQAFLLFEKNSWTKNTKFKKTTQNWWQKLIVSAG